MSFDSNEKSFKAIKTSQLELGIPREVERDRNFHLGGRSFYFFDFDDNVAFLSTPLILFNKQSKAELAITSGEFARHHAHIGQDGIYENFEINYCDLTGTFRNFRDAHIEELEKLNGKRQVFVEDIAHALGLEDYNWKGPSWSTFYHATFNQRPVSVITARGHSPLTIKEGIDLFVKEGHLPCSPDYLSIFPVNHIPTRKELGDENLKMSTAQLKQTAIRASVEEAILQYGKNPHHRFGMSDDDPKNLSLIIEEMTSLKKTYPGMSFFVIDTQRGEFIKHEVTGSGQVIDSRLGEVEQISFFEK